jgi:hypothetical protein
LAEKESDAADDKPGIPQEFWEELDKRIDAGYERWLAKLDTEEVEDAGKANAGGARPNAGAGAGGDNGAGAAPAGGPAAPANPRRQASGSNFFDVLSRVALGKSEK